MQIFSIVPHISLTRSSSFLVSNQLLISFTKFLFSFISTLISNPLSFAITQQCFANLQILLKVKKLLTSFRHNH